eukprot:m.439995 g.439995  ORF g.439995 m.439995 type:complete len:108 (-) comp18450_c0_seq1:136-459(-)
MPWKPPPPAPKCPSCNKSVYAAELVRACEKDWHKACLKCKKCSKTLASGSFLEKEGVPYCEKPCYQALFGPGGFRGGGGGAANSYESHGEGGAEVDTTSTLEHAGLK